MNSSERLQIILNHIISQPFLKNTSTMKYKYTLDNNLMTDIQRDFYEDNGFLIVKNLVDHDLLDECKKRFVDLCNGKIPKNRVILMKDITLMETNAQGEHLIYKAQDVHWDEVMFKYMQDPNILQYIECFTGPNITAVSLMLINKPPDSGKLSTMHPLHQDLNFFPFRPADRIVASWTAMEKVTAENGCLFVIPGTHKSALQPHEYPEIQVNKGYHGIRGLDLVPRLNLELEKGDTIFFHPLLMHGSGINITKGFRKALTGHYVSCDCYYIDVKDTAQQNFAGETEEIAKKQGFNVTIQDIYKYRQRLIKGRTGTMFSSN